MSITSYHLPDTAGTEAAGDMAGYIVRLSDTVDQAAVEALREALGAQVVEQTQSWGFELWETDAPITAELLASFADEEWYGAVSTSVAYLQPDLVIDASSITSDPHSDRLWGLHNDGTNGLAGADIDVQGAWDRSRGAGVTVAVLDTGIDASHPDLVDSLWINSGEIPGNGRDDDRNGYVDDVYGYDFISNRGDAVDGNGHGTHIAGTIAATADNGVGVVGVAPEAKIMALKVLRDNGTGSTFDAIQALEYAVTMGADVSNMSWGGDGYNWAFENALAEANEAGHVVVAAAGNSSVNLTDDPHFPANYDVPNVISVAATNSYDRLASFSNYGITSVDVAAPGRSIYSTLPGGTYGTKSGTSMAAPHVTGTVALLLASEPWLTPAEVRQRLIDTSDVMASLIAYSISGGRINADAALGEAPGNRVTGQIMDDAEQPLGGWFVFLDANGDGIRQSTEAATRTDANGRYVFDGLVSGPHTLAVLLEPGYAHGDLAADGLSSGPRVDISGAVPLWHDISSTGTRLDLGDDGTQAVDLPFAVQLWDTIVTTIHISANGLIGLSDPGGAYTPRALDMAPPGIFPMWTDLSLVHGGAIYVQADPNADEVVVQYQDIRGFDGLGPYSFQVVLHRDGDIDFLYGDHTAPPPDARIGLRGTDASEVLELSRTDLDQAGGRVRLTSKPTVAVLTDVHVDVGQTDVDPITVTPDGLPIGEIIQATGTGGSALTVSFGRRFTDPVVFILDPVTGWAVPSATMSISKIKGQSVTLDTGGYIGPFAIAVFETGQWYLPDGTVMEVGQHSTGRLSSSGFDQVSFGQSFHAPPLVLSQVQATKSTTPDALYTRQAGASVDQFALALERPEALNAGTVAPVTAGWIAVSPGSGGTAGEVTVEVLAATTSGQLASFDFTQDLSSSPFVLSAMTTANDADAARSKVVYGSSASVTLATIEDRSHDDETTHGAETVAVIGFGGAGQITGRAGTGASVSGTVWQDLDNDGVQDVDEPGVADAIVFWDNDGDGARGSDERMARTDANGAYRFDGLAPGPYSFAVEAGSAATLGGGAFTKDTFAWHEISGLGQKILGLGDDRSFTLDLPFTFPFFGEGYGEVTVSANGHLTFGGDGSQIEFASSPEIGPTIAALWSDLTLVDSGAVYAWSDPSNDRFVVQFENVRAYGTADVFNFQMVLSADGSVSLAYGVMSAMPDGAWRGVSDGAGTVVSLDATQPRSYFTYTYDPDIVWDAAQSIMVGPSGEVRDVDFAVTDQSNAVASASADLEVASEFVTQVLPILSAMEGTLDL
ncbi:MAG: S8 family serine peptidase [Pseudomonadota bacterium]